MKSYLLIFCLLVLFNVYLYSFEPVIKWNNRGGQSELVCYTFSNDGKSVYVHLKYRDNGLTNFKIQKINLKDNNIESEIESDYTYNKLSLSHDGNLLACALKGTKYINLINLNDNSTKTISTLTGTSISNEINSMTFSDDGSKIYAVTTNVPEIQIINTESLKRIDSIPLMKPVYYLRFSQDNKLAAYKSNDTVYIIDVINKKEKFKIFVKQATPYSVSFDLGEQYFIITYNADKVEKNVEIYSMENGKILSSYSSIYKNPYSRLINEKYLVISSEYPYGKIESYNILTKEKKMLDITLDGSGMEYNHQSGMITGRDSSRLYYIYKFDKPDTKILLNRISANFRKASKIIVSDDNKYVFAAGVSEIDTLKKGKIKIHDFETGKIFKTIYVAENYLCDMYLSKDGNKIYTADSLGIIYIISNIFDDNPTIKSIKLCSNISSFTVSDDETKLIAGGYMTGFYYLNLLDETIKSYFTDPYKTLELEPDIHSIIFSHSGHKLYIAGKKKNINEFLYNSNYDEFDQGEIFKGDSSLNPGNAGILSISVTDDDKFILSQASDGYIHQINTINYSCESRIKVRIDSLDNYPCRAILTKDNSKVISGDSYPFIKITDFNTHENIWEVKMDSSRYFPISSLSLTGDNLYMAFSAEDGSYGLYQIDENTSVRNVVDSILRIYPNPVGDYITISLGSWRPPSRWTPTEIEIYDILGVKIQTTPLSSTSLSNPGANLRIDVSHLPAGVYLIKIGDKVEKFLKL